MARDSSYAGLVDTPYVTTSFWFLAPTFPGGFTDTLGLSGALGFFGTGGIDFDLGGYSPLFIAYCRRSLNVGSDTFRHDPIFSVSAFTQDTNLNIITLANWDFGGDGLSLVSGNWYHFFLAIDTSVLPNIGYCYLNAQRLKSWSGTPPSDGYSFTTEGFTSSPGTFDIPFLTDAQTADYEIAIPTIRAFLSGTNTLPVNPTPFSQPQLVMAEFQMWLGTFIDPTISSNFSKFVTISNGRGTPVNPAVAAAAFGQQTFLFKGKPSQGGTTNHGDGGTFATFGTTNDYAAPSF